MFGFKTKERLALLETAMGFTLLDSESFYKADRDRTVFGQLARLFDRTLRARENASEIEALKYRVARLESVLEKLLVHLDLELSKPTPGGELVGK